MNRMIPLALVVIAAVALGAYFLLPSNVQNVAVADETLSSETQDTDASVVATGGIEDMILGDPNAPITMIEYASYTCPHCGSFHQNTYPQLKADYIDTGKVKFIFREVYFDRFGLWASMVARCGGQDRFFGITDLMFKTQGDWTRAGDAPVIVEELRKIGRLAGLNNETLESCLQNEDQAKALVAWYQENAARDDINSTPSFIINGRKYANMGYAEMQEVLDGLL
ncbi:MAG: DsbA family protein [Cognatishimia sp.]|uniref:DsbA family protein n=1 Tax=Cognatishimia sp. TaxID=2211648 RepID=UPI004058AB7E